jgi:hypothetical protein
MKLFKPRSRMLKVYQARLTSESRFKSSASHKAQRAPGCLSYFARLCSEQSEKTEATLSGALL